MRKPAACTQRSLTSSRASTRSGERGPTCRTSRDATGSTSPAPACWTIWTASQDSSGSIRPLPLPRDSASCSSPSTVLPTRRLSGRGFSSRFVRATPPRIRPRSLRTRPRTSSTSRYTPIGSQPSRRALAPWGIQGRGPGSSSRRPCPRPSARGLPSHVLHPRTSTLTLPGITSRPSIASPKRSIRSSGARSKPAARSTGRSSRRSCAPTGPRQSLGASWSRVPM